MMITIQEARDWSDQKRYHRILRTDSHHNFAGSESESKCYHADH